MKNPYNYCDPNFKMSSTNVDDAKKECGSIPSCFMFFDNEGNGKVFRGCTNTASMESSTIGSILYQGNTKCLQFNI